jgi:hypothetical protein
MNITATTTTEVSVFASPAMNMNSHIHILKSPKRKANQIDLKILATTMGVWKTEPSASCLSATTESSESCTPRLLSASNSVTGASPKRARKRTKKRGNKLFKKYLTLQDLGVSQPSVRNSDRGYSLTYPPTFIERRLPSQDVLMSNPPPVAVDSKSPAQGKPSRVSFSPLTLDNISNLHQSRTKSSVRFTSSATPTLAQLKKALKTKLIKAKENRPTKRQRNARYRCAPEPNKDRGQKVDVVDMNTGVLYLYSGGDLPRKIVFIRSK